MYQNGDVDFLVATDAIGMGLNLDVHHVAFADDHKFDGHQTRPLTPAEFGQIAGRAGRHMHNGTLRGHRQCRRVRRRAGQAARNATISSRSECCNGATPSSISARSTTCAPASTGRPQLQALTRVPIATDQHALEFLARNEAARLATSARRGAAALGVLRHPGLSRYLAGPARRNHHPHLFRPAGSAAMSTPTGLPSRCGSATM